MTPFPSIFVSHGAPDLLLHPSPALDFLKQLGTKLGKPKAILVISAHWLTRTPTVSAAPQTQAIYDFGGFPNALYQMEYSAPGAPQLAAHVRALLTQAGGEVDVHPSRGLDHGAWEPLLLMYPEANIPVTQLSIQPYFAPSYHLQLGRALAPLREEGVLIMASGATTHNLRAFGQYDFNAKPPHWAQEFDQWLAGAIAANNLENLLDYRKQAPYAIQNHPSEDHLLPLFVAMGAAGEPSIGTQLHASFTYGVFSMAAYAFNSI